MSLGLQYYERVRTNPIALTVKLADINDNSDPERLSRLDQPTRERLEAKYAWAINRSQPRPDTTNGGADEDR